MGSPVRSPMGTLRDRDDAVWNLLDEHPGLSAREVGDALGFSRTTAHQSLARLEAAGLVERSDPTVMPLAWVVTGAPDDAKIELTRKDARLVVHMLRAMLREDRAGPPTAALVERLEALLED